MNFIEVHWKYTKINTLYKRDEKGKIMYGEFSRPEFEYLYNNKWLAFEKIDGTNMSYYWDGHEMQIHGKTENATIPAHLLKKMEQILSPEKLAEILPIEHDEEGNEKPFMVRIYGEGYGNKIQKCGKSYISNDTDFIVFDININGYWLEWDDVVELCHKLNLKHVTLIGEMTIKEAEDMVIKGFTSLSSEDKNLMAEGLVLRPKIQLFNKMKERIMVKIKRCDYKTAK